MRFDGWVGPLECQPKTFDWVLWAPRHLEVCSQSLGNELLNGNFHWLQFALAASNYFYLLEQGEQETKVALWLQKRTG